MYSWMVLVTPTTKAIIRESARLVNLTLGRAGFLFYREFLGSGMGYGTWNARLVNLTLGRAGFLFYREFLGSGMGYGTWNARLINLTRQGEFSALSRVFGFGYGVWNMEHKGGCRSAPPLVFSLILSLSLTFPHWLSPPPPRAVQTLWNKLSVGADFLPRQSRLSMVATPLFCLQKSKPLTTCF